jgi:hypothetical protein
VCVYVCVCVRARVRCSNAVECAFFFFLSFFLFFLPLGWRKVVGLLEAYAARSTVLRATFAEALALFPDEYFDLVYLDGYAHTGNDGTFSS